VRVELLQSELALRGYTPESFKILPIPNQRWVASNIMRNRGDERSQFAADMMERANPNFNDFVLLNGV
jgi:hypothetical protein